MFRNATQNPGESLDSYCTRLRRLAQACEFTNEDEEIKSDIVVSFLSSRLRRRALRDDMTLKALLDYGRGLEMSEKQAKVIEEQEKLAKISDVQTVKEGKRPPESKKCYRCGENYPHKGRPCPALDETCKHCYKKGYFTRVCRSRSTSKKVNTVDERDGDESTDEEYTYRIMFLKKGVKTDLRNIKKLNFRPPSATFLRENILPSYGMQIYRKMMSLFLAPKGGNQCRVNPGEWCSFVDRV